MLVELSVRQRFPDLSSVGNRLFVGSNPERPSVSRYAASLEVRGHLTPAVRESVLKAQTIRENTRVLVYIAGPLTGMDEKTKARYGLVSELLDSYTDSSSEKKLFFGYVPHLHGTDPVKHPNVTPEEVRDIDNLWASVVADFHVNFLYPTAHGNAIEEGWAEKSMIPTVYLNPKGNKLSRLTIGMNNVAELLEYDEFEKGGIEKVKTFFDELSVWLKYFPDSDPREFFYMSFSQTRDPILREEGLDPKQFNPVFPVKDIFMYVKNPNNPRFGQVGKLLAHDWKESGELHIEFSDGVEIVQDTAADFSYWPK